MPLQMRQNVQAAYDCAVHLTVNVNAKHWLGSEWNAQCGARGSRGDVMVCRVKCDGVTDSGVTKSEGTGELENIAVMCGLRLQIKLVGAGSDQTKLHCPVLD